MPSLEQIPEEPSPQRPGSPLSEGSFDARRTVNFSRPRPFSPTTSNPSSALASPTFEHAPDLDKTPTVEKSPILENSPVIDQAFRPQLRSHEPGPRRLHEPPRQLETWGDQSSHTLRHEQSSSSAYRTRDEARTARSERPSTTRHALSSQSMDEDDDAAPFPVIRTYSEQHDLPFHSKVGTPQTWIYKPYADSVVSSHDSDASSIASEETMTTEDTDSIADSTTTGYSEASDFTFDGRLGWNPSQRPSQAERERQRWAAPVIQQPYEERDRRYDVNIYDRDQGLPQRSEQPTDVMYTSNSNRESWLSDSSNGTVTTRDSDGLPSMPVPRPVNALTNGHANGSSSANTRKNHRDIFEAASERQGSLYAPDSGNVHRLGRTVSNATDRSKVSDLRRPGDLTINNMSRHNVSNGNARPSRPRDVTSASSSSLDSADWKGSEVDISSLSPEKIRKLEKKGINPALYLEMKQARCKGGKKKSGFVGVLTGNSFLS
ncbi:hypothetical protein CAC42_6600 [Sphaceloma murrayae]|uniref:Uncharacterized protein n=1 Tax=Sphaceloma murrayae TaxID=2082308 RepID=A0A2K1QFX7_9PEZI|nr:hypothetical protein CAC42_6600 [Sphaceloma murrayae]